MRGVAILVAISMLIVIFPTISADVDTDDALDIIPIPNGNTEGHTVISADLCQMMISNTMSAIETTDIWTSKHWNCDKSVWNGTFEEYDDSDVLKIESIGIESIGMIRICIESSEVPMEMGLWLRNTTSLSEIGNSTRADTPTQISICKMYSSHSDDAEHWLKLNSLSTSGNYSISIILIEFGSMQGNVGSWNNFGIITPIIPLPLESFTQYSVAYSDRGIQNSINITVNSPHVIYKLKSHSTTPHTLLIFCHSKEGLVWSCGDINSTFSETDNHELHRSEYNYYPPKNASMIEVKISSMEVSTWVITNQMVNNYSEISSGDASSYIENCEVNGDSCGNYENANMGTSIRGYLPMAIYDDSDTWELNIPGKLGDTFVGQFTTRSSNENGVFLEISAVDSNGNITNYQETIGTDWKSISIDLEAGTHYIKITNLILLGSEQNWEYGEINQSVITYDIQIDWVSNVTNESIIFGPSEELLFWDRILVCSMGPMFLLPFVYVLFTMRVDMKRKNELLFDLERLKRLRKILSEDELKDAKLDLRVSLKALANIEWETIIESWGEPEISYQTKDMDIACWILDSRLSNDEGIPIMLGINVKGEMWENAAVRFDTSKGKEQFITSVKPKLLYNNNEIFLDQLGSKSRTFVQINLKHVESVVNIHISGMQSGMPVATQPTSGLDMTSEE